MMRDVLSALLAFATASGPALAADLPGAMPLTATFAERLVTEGLRQIGAGDAFQVKVERPRLPLGNQEAALTEIVVENLRHDQTTGRFSAVLVGTVGAQPRFQLSLEGRAQPLTSVAVLARPIGRGEQIGPGDIDRIEVAARTLPQASLIEAEQLIGAEARRRLAPGRVLTSRDVGPPRLVRRGEPVRVVYVDGGLRLTAQGKARDDGGFGEPIRVINPESELQLQGIATGPAEVTVGDAVMPGGGN